MSLPRTQFRVLRDIVDDRTGEPLAKAGDVIVGQTFIGSGDGDHNLITFEADPNGEWQTTWEDTGDDPMVVITNIQQRKP